MNNGTLLLLHDAAGIPFALMVAGYTGVLLSCTANPLWSKNPWLGPLFSASAISTGAEALSLALDLTTRDRGVESSSHSILRKVDTAAHVAELACMAGFGRHAGERAKVLNRGAIKTHHRISLGGIIAAEVLKQLPVGPRLQKPVRMVAAALGLAAGFSMRWSMVFGGHAAAADQHLSRDVSRPRPSKARENRTMPHPGGAARQARKSVGRRMSPAGATLPAR
jgi:formate-dependent nitrite reductase membrane component NrfD